MAKRWTNKLTWKDVTPEAAWLNRRQLMAGAAGLAGASIAGPLLASGHEGSDLEPNTWEEITSYNNFYEFGTAKDDPARNAGQLTTDPWSIKIDGLVDRPGDYSLAEIMEGLDVEERIYQFRCVEAWSMVVLGMVSGKDILDKAVQSDAKYVAFETLVRPSECLVLRATFWIGRIAKACALMRRCIH